MMLSIRTRLFISVSSLLLFFVLLSLGLTRLGLEKFYTWQKKDLLIASSKAMDGLYQGKPEENSLELERIANTLGAGILILNPEGYIKYSPFGPTYDRPLPFPFTFKSNNATESRKEHHPHPPEPILIARETIDSRTTLEMRQDYDLKIDFIFLEHQLQNDDILIIRQPLAPISESATVAAQFMVFTGLLSILVGCIWAFFFAKKFTRPILELSHIAQSMSNLDFSQKCTIDRSDEVGELGKSINHLSNQLDTAISELHQKNKQLMADVEQERKLDKMRKDFVSNVSHELKTPLSLILGYAEGLKENVPKDEAGKNYYCSVIIDEAERMDKLVKDLLNLSQIESGFYQLNRTNFDLSLLISSISQKYLTLLTEKEITLQKDIEVNCLVNGDVLRIEQILLNLLNNAIDHAEFGKTIKIWIEDTGDAIRAFVYNSGRPIPEESLEKIWISFYKMDKARTREFGRYGLGLSIVRAIQELHGNSYGVKNTQDGVIFWFNLDKFKNI
jgi:two-component system sensor histidine kinase VanS